MLNTIIAESLDWMVTQLEKKSGKNPTPAKRDAAVRTVLKEVVKKHRKVCFDGDGYSDAWVTEAEERGLPNLHSTADALPVIKNKASMDLFKKYRVLNNRELKARYEIFVEQYSSVLTIETNTLLTLLKTQVMPAAIQYQTQLAEAVTATHAAGAECRSTQGLLLDVISGIDSLQKSITALTTERTRAYPSADKRMKSHREQLVPAMEQARADSDRLEEIIPRDLWPLPTYAEMLLIR